jgi:long-chain acyl-CoA synthetase
MTTPSSTATAPYAPADIHAVCAREEDRTLTWAQWNDQANRFASSLATLGIGKGDIVAVRMRTRLEWLIISLGLAKLGAVIVAVNYRLAPQEATYILRDCRARAAVVDDSDTAPLVEAWSELQLAAIVGLDEPREGISHFDTLVAQGDPSHRAAASLAQIIIYTSGTTGAPKGAPLQDWQSTPEPTVYAEYMRSVMFNGASGGPGNVTLVNLPMHHGAGAGYTSIALATGGTVVFQRRFDAEATLELIDRHKITHWVSVPTMLQRILKLPPEVRASYDVSSLRYVVGGAMPFSAQLKKQIIDYFGPVLYELYGATEPGMMAGASPADLAAKPRSSGKPFAHVDIKIVDQQGNTLPPNHTGEILVRTPTIISGYIGRGRLGPDKIDADGYYRTGDVGHLDEQNYLFIDDRITDMIIAGGVNIYPAEIETVLVTHPDVANAAVIGIPDDDLGEQPIAVVELEPGADATAGELLEFCVGKLAKYKLPRRVEFVEALPTNTVGKTLKRVLREPYWADRKASI